MLTMPSFTNTLIFTHSHIHPSIHRSAAIVGNIVAENDEC